MSKQIEIKIEGPKLTPEKFLKATKAFFDLVLGVSRNLANRELEWTVEVESGSNIIRAKSQEHEADQAVRAVVRGVGSLKSGIQVIPPLYGRDEVIAARTLAAIVDGASITSIGFQNGTGPEDVSKSVVATADAILDAGSSIAYGAIEGVIDGLSIRDGFRCTVFEPNYRRGINCLFNKKELEMEAHRAFGKRVLVSGMLKYSKDGLPVTLHADSLRVFPNESELPTLQEIQAIYREIYQ